jgi:hypothetical protein
MAQPQQPQQPQQPHRPQSGKSSQRLDYARLSEVLAERGMCEPQALREALNFSGRGHSPFAEALVNAKLVADWELSRIVAELYNLPFMPVDMCEPDPKARAGIDINFLIENGLVPLARFGQVVTVAMPGMVPAEILGLLAAETDLYVLPVVGTVQSNRRWIEMNLQEALRSALPVITPEAQQQANEWGNIFDAGDAAVLLDLKLPGED